MVKSGLRICGSADIDIDKLELNFIFRLRAVNGKNGNGKNGNGKLGNGKLENGKKGNR